MQSLVILAFVAASFFAPSDSTSRSIDLDEVEVISTVKEDTEMRQQPSSVSMVKKQQLADNHITSLKGVSALVPNFFMPDYGSRLTSAIYIRGIGSRINTPAVGMYVDNIPYVDKSAFDFNFYDIERVDILRGPQGTLYGRNAMGGIVRIYTKNPFSYEGTDVNLGYATGDNHRTASLTHYHRMSDKFAFSLGGYYEGGSGFFKNSFTGKKADKIQAGGGRWRSIFKASDNLSFDLTASYDYSDEGAYPYFYTGTIGEGAADDSERIGKINNNRESKYRRGLFNAGLNIEYKAPLFVMNAITGFQNINDRMFMDQDFMPEDIYTLEQKQRVNTVNEEITFKNRNADSRWHWVSGANFMYQALHTEAPVTFYGDGLSWLETNINSVMPDISKIPMLKGMGFSSMSMNFLDEQLQMKGEYETPLLNMALFHQSTIDLTDRLSFTAGLRLDYEKLKADYYSPAIARYGFAMPNANNPKMSIDMQDLVSTNIYDGILKDDNLRLLPKFAIKYDLASAGNVYASASMGQRSGGYNLQMFSDLLQGKMRIDMMDGIKEGVRSYLDNLVKQNPYMPSQIPDPENPGSKIGIPDYVARVMNSNMPNFEAPAAEQIVYKPEYSWNYEVGTHLNLADKRLCIDAAAFLINTRNQQIARFAPNGFGRMMVNAGKSRSYGGEVAAMWRPDSHIAINANYGYTHAKFTDYDSGEGNDYTGNYVPFVPKHTLHLDAAYTWHLSDTRWARNLTLAADYKGAGALYWTESNNAKQPFYSLFGARLALSTSIATIQLWTRNLTDKNYNTFYFESASRGYEQHGKPFQFGVDVKFAIK